MNKEHRKVLDEIAESIPLDYCPFCGTTSEDLENAATHGDWWWVECDKCSAQSSIVRTPQQAAEIWNSIPRKPKNSTKSNYTEISKCD